MKTINLLVIPMLSVAAAGILMTGCAPEDSYPAEELFHKEAAEPLPPLALDAKIGEIRDLPLMPVADAHWGGTSSSQDEFIYEPPPGWIIYSVTPVNVSSFGDAWYTVHVLAANSKFATASQFSDSIKELQKAAATYKNYMAQADLERFHKNVTTWSETGNTFNSALHIKWGGRSREITAGPIPVVIDTKTASLHLSVRISIIRAASPAELEALTTALKQRISRGQSVANYLEEAPT
jgi:hypothetical protein